MIRRLWIIFIVIVLFISGFYLYMHRDRARAFYGTETVYIKAINDKPQLFWNGKPFYIKGASGSTHIKELSEAGGNTLRVYDTINLLAILDEAKKHDIAVIVDIPLPAYNVKYDYYKISENTELLKENIKKFVRHYKSHPALLIWNLGNEIEYPLTLTENEFIKTFNSVIDLIHEEDPNHLISTSLKGTSKRETLGVLLNSPKLDLIGFNTFGNIPQLQPLMKNAGYITSLKPYYITEWGIHGPWESPLNLWWSVIETNSTDKGEIYKNIYESYIENNSECLGSLAFYWGYKHEGTPTWFNIFDEKGRKSQAYYNLKSAWTGEKITNTVPKINQLKLNDSLSRNLFVLPDSILDAELTILDPMDLTYSFRWSIYKEAWGKKKWRKESDSIIISQSALKSSSNMVKLKVPHEEGPYRLFVSVIDGSGNFATINRPFYVLSRK